MTEPVATSDQTLVIFIAQVITIFLLLILAFRDKK
jgi:hypothetical protein